MALDEKDMVQLSNLSEERVFVREFSEGSQGKLVKPIAFPNLQTLVGISLLSIGAILFFARIINPGIADLNWHLTFDVNLVIVALVFLSGAFSVGTKVRKNPEQLRDQTTVASIIVLLLVIGFFLFRVIDLGNFDYTLDKIDLSSVVGLLFIGALSFLAFTGSKTSIMVLALLFLWWGFSIRNFGFETVNDLFTSENGGRLLRSLTPPKWGYFIKVIDPMLLTVQTAVASTVIGVAFALPLSILAARNTSPHPVIYNVIRLIINAIRSIPSLILALLFIPFVGLGPAAGILGLAIHSVSVLTKLFSEAFESVKPQPLEALNAVGANGLKSFRWGVFPQAFPLVASYSIFNWESNGRDSTVVAFVGGGGIGFLLQANLSLLDYANVSVMLIVLILTVSMLDRFSDFVRKRII